jgi:hypothetical protein
MKRFIWKNNWHRACGNFARWIISIPWLTIIFGGKKKQKKNLKRQKQNTNKPWPEMFCSLKIDVDAYGIHAKYVTTKNKKENSSKKTWAREDFARWMSMPMASMPIRLAAARIVPVPQNGSQTHLVALKKPIRNTLPTH